MEKETRFLKGLAAAQKNVYKVKTIFVKAGNLHREFFVKHYFYVNFQRIYCAYFLGKGIGGLVEQLPDEQPQSL